MSRFLSKKYDRLKPYTPGEQPRERKYIKLNTNESPFPPSPLAVKYAREEAERLMLYSDPECRELSAALAKELGVLPSEVILTNGSDEVLNFAFMAYCDENTPAVFPDITYGFYKVFANLSGVPYREIPLTEDFRIDLSEYPSEGTLFIANPNAPTGIALSVSQIEAVIKANPGRMVVVDEAYVDFGAESCIPLIKKYDNLLVTGTFSKSRSMAGARLGFGAASEAIINDLTRIRYSTNPYNVNRMTAAAGIGALRDGDYFRENCKSIIEIRDKTAAALRALGFDMTESEANFLFIRHPKISGKELYLALRENGILVRHFDAPRISEYNRVTIGNAQEMQTFIDTIKKISELKI
ncbi:MAG: histidinol-phosphate transaminase [Ruminococcaceae bacterium]|nr:histidinol-phosphate transaminase [Oscillospiraceae bacterium]